MCASLITITIQCILQKLHKKKQYFELWTQNIYKDWFLETLRKIDEQWQDSIYKPRGAGNNRAVPGTEQTCVLAHAGCCCEWRSLKLFLFVPVCS